MDKRKVVKEFIKKEFKLLSKNNKEMNFLLKSSCIAGENVSDKYITYREREKFLSLKNIFNPCNEFKEKCAVIIQGPLRKEDNFTIETIKLYRKLYPNVIIILTTWNDLEEQYERELKKSDIVIVKSQKPKITGLGNINFQLVSTNAGIDKASELKCKYILKTRTDQRIYKTHFLEYFMNLLKIFKINTDDKQMERVITGPSLISGTMFKPYVISDFFYFGRIEDIKKIFSLSQSDVNMTTEEREKWITSLKGKKNVSDFFYLTAPEVHLIKNFADIVTSRKNELTIKDYWNFVKSKLICLGWNDLNLYWPKYEIYNESKLDSTNAYGENDVSPYCWDFANWLLLYNEQLMYDEKYEKYTNEIKL